MKIGDVIKHGHSTGVIYEILGETWSKYDPPAGSLRVIISDENGAPYKLDSSNGMRYFSFTVYNIPDEIERVSIIGHIDPDALAPFMKERNEEAESDRMRSLIEPHFEGTIRQSGDMFVTKTRRGTHCYVYFAGKTEKSD